MDGTFPFGIEEEFFLADAITRGRPDRSLDAFHAAARRPLPKAERELLQAQVEIASPLDHAGGSAPASLSAVVDWIAATTVVSRTADRQVSVSSHE